MQRSGSPSLGMSRDRLRAVTAVGVLLAVVVVGGVFSPFAVRRPAELTALPRPRVEVQVEGSGASSTRLHGTYLQVANHERASAFRALLAALRSDETSQRWPSVSQVEQEQPANMGALIGLGLSPARMQGAPMPITVALHPTVDQTSLAVALQLFDVTSPLDAANGRTIIGLGRVLPDGALACDRGWSQSLAATGSASVDLVIVPTACGPGERPSGGARVQRVASLPEAARVLAEGAGR